MKHTKPIYRVQPRTDCAKIINLISYDYVSKHVISFISYRSPSPARIKSAMPMNEGNKKRSSQAQPNVVSIELQFDCMPIVIGYRQ